MKPKILIFSLAYAPLVGGAEVALHEITQRIQSFDFDLITARFSRSDLPQERIGNVMVYRVGFGSYLDKYLFFVLAYFKALSLHRENHYQIVWAMLANYAGLGALLFKWTVRIKYYLTDQSGDSDSFIKKRTWFWLPLYKQIYQRADRIQVISHWLKERARSYGYRGEIDLVPNGVDIGRFSQEISPAEKATMLSQLSVKSDDKIIITVSRLVEKNGISDLIESLNYLDNQYKLLILGQGKLSEELKLKAENLKLTERVQFLGEKNHDEVVRYLNIAYVFIRPSLSEGFGNVFVEAMATGLPVIATSVGGIKDFLIDGETGLICNVNNPQSIAGQVKRLAADESLRNKLIQNGLALAKNYSWEAIAAQMNQSLNKLL